MDEKLPNKYNVPEAAVYREGVDTNVWVVVKPRGEVLPSDSPILTDPQVTTNTILDLTVSPEGGTFEHVDIIRFDE